MQKAIDQLVGMGALKKVTKASDFAGAIKDPKKIPDFAGPALKVESGSSPEQQIQSKSKTSRRATMLTGPRGLKDTDLKVKRKKLLGTES